MNNNNKPENELHDAPFLSAHPRETGFSTPSNYFESFDARLQERLANEAPLAQKPQAEAAVRWLQPRFAAAAAAVVLLLACFALWQNSVEDSTASTPMAQYSASSALEGVSLEEAEAYVLEHIEEFDDELIMASMSGEESMTNDLSEEELEQYLKEEGLENLSDEELEQLL